MAPQAADQNRDSRKTLFTDKAATRHLIVASNRGPTSASTQAAEIPHITGNAGMGHVANLKGTGTITRISVAATGADRAAAEQAENGLITGGFPAGSAARLVVPSRRAYHRYYNIICNPLLWFLHHRSWGYTHTPNIDREAHSAWEQGFVAISRMLADEIATEANRCALPVKVQLNDYHMHLVGGMVRELSPDAEISYAPNVPWPSPADWMMLPGPWRKEIFSGMLACDVIELTSQRDIRSLQDCFREFCPEIEIDQKQIKTPGDHMLRLQLDPLAIDLDALQSAADSDRCQASISRLAADPRYTLVTAERTEPHKNIVRCLRAYGSLLDSDRTLAEDTRYLVVLAPPPPHLSQYRRYLSEIEKAAAEVNNRHRARAGKPIQLVVENNYPKALAAMSIADTLVSVPIADASYATQLSTPLINQRDCTLILSETSTAAEVFGDSAALVSPSDVEAIKREMLCAIELTAEERAKRFTKVISLARSHTDQARQSTPPPQGPGT